MISLIGLNHKTATLDLREALAVDLATLREKKPPEILSYILLSTCNRWELYTHAIGHDQDVEHKKNLVALHKHWLTQSGADPIAIASAQSLTDFSAARHLMRVAAGLESLVLGEPQILGQIITAHSKKTGDHLLNTLFRLAIRAGKRVRTETAINHHPSNVSSAAIAHLPQPLTNQKIIVVGAGEMARLAYNALQQRGVCNITILNRTPNNISFNADKIGDLNQLPDALISADAIITATGSPKPLITYSQVASLLPAREGKPLTLIDLAVPRNIEPAANTITGVSLLNMDTITETLTRTHQARQREIPHAESIIDECMTEWDNQLKEFKVRPILKHLHQKADSIRQRELARTLQSIGEGLDETTKAHIIKLSQVLVSQLLHTPTQQIRHEALASTNTKYAIAIQALFQLDDCSQEQHQATH